PSQNRKTQRPSRVFYLIGSILLAVWALNKFGDQNAATSSTNSSRNSNLVSPGQSDSSIDTSPTVRRALPVETSPSPTDVDRALQLNSAVSPAASPLPTASAYAAAPFRLPAPSPSIAAGSTYRVANVRKGDFLYLRGGPGADYRPILRIHPGTGGIM